MYWSKNYVYIKRGANMSKELEKPVIEEHLIKLKNQIADTWRTDHGYLPLVILKYIQQAE